MRKPLSLAALTLIALAATTTVSPAWADELASPMIPPKASTRSMPQDVASAWGCVIVGSAGTAAAASANSVNLLNVVAGGIVTPANPAVLYIGLAGVVFSTFCTLGQQITPLYLYYFHEENDPEIDLARSGGQQAGQSIKLLALESEDPLHDWQKAKQ